MQGPRAVPHPDAAQEQLAPRHAAGHQADQAVPRAVQRVDGRGRGEGPVVDDDSQCGLCSVARVADNVRTHSGTGSRTAPSSARTSCSRIDWGTRTACGCRSCRTWASSWFPGSLYRSQRRHTESGASRWCVLVFSRCVRPLLVQVADSGLRGSPSYRAVHRI